jgi:hypothetical protein
VAGWPHNRVRYLAEPVEGRPTKEAGNTMTTSPGPGPGRDDPGLDAVIGERRHLTL